jgi:hypothetical protein
MKRVAFFVLAGLLVWALPGRARADTPAPAEEKEGTITGLAIQRPQGGWIGVEIKSGCFRITFYNDKKKPIAADRTSAVLRWTVHYQPNAERTELVGSDEPAVLTNSYPVKEPHTFKLHIALMKDGSDEPESYVVDFNSD